MHKAYWFPMISGLWILFIGLKRFQVLVLDNLVFILYKAKTIGLTFH